MSHRQRHHPLTPVLEAFTAAWPADDVHTIEHAYHVAARCHRGQRRKSGDPFIVHPVAVGRTVAELGARKEIVCAALLHDAAYPPGHLRAEFGADVAALVDGLGRLDADGDVTGANHDVLLLKLADRLDNMRTIQYLDTGKQHRKSVHTLQTVVPLATRLGVRDIAQELADLATDVLHRADCAVSRSTSFRVLVLATVLLPRALRSRWLTEWAGELAVLPTRTVRVRFVIELVGGIPRLAWTLRHPMVAGGPHAKPGTARRASGSLLVGGCIATIFNANMTWAAATVVLGILALAAVVLFADGAAHRLGELIRAWRDMPPR